VQGVQNLPLRTPFLWISFLRALHLDCTLIIYSGLHKMSPPPVKSPAQNGAPPGPGVGPRGVSSGGEYFAMVEARCFYPAGLRLPPFPFSFISVHDIVIIIIAPSPTEPCFPSGPRRQWYYDRLCDAQGPSPVEEQGPCVTSPQTLQRSASSGGLHCHGPLTCHAQHSFPARLPSVAD